MTKVYIVVADYMYEGTEVRGVFSSKDKATQVMNCANDVAGPNRYVQYYVEEYTLDEPEGFSTKIMEALQK